MSARPDILAELAGLKARVKALEASHDHLAESAKQAYAHNSALAGMIVNMLAGADEKKRKAVVGRIDKMAGLAMAEIEKEAAKLAAQSDQPFPPSKPQLVH